MRELVLEAVEITMLPVRERLKSRFLRLRMVRLRKEFAGQPEGQEPEMIMDSTWKESKVETVLVKEAVLESFWAVIDPEVGTWKTLAGKLRMIFPFAGMSLRG